MADNNENKVLNVPHLRFPEFTDEWKESVLSDFVERVKRKNKNNLCKLPLTISAQYGLVDQISFFNKVIASENMSNYYLLHKGDFAYNKSYSSEYPWGAIKRLDCYEQGTLSSLYICFKPYSHVSSDFLTHYFETSKWHQGISEIAVEGARNHGLLNVGIQDFFETRHCLPQSLLEQEKIAKFLNLIEERIATQNKIIEKYESLIQAMCDTLIERETQQVALSFSDFGQSYSGLSGKNAEDFGDGYPFITYMNVYQNQIIDSTDVGLVKIKETEQQSVVHYGDILFTLSSETPEEVGMGAVYLGETYPLYLNSFCFGIHITDEAKIYSPFLAYYVSSQSFRKAVYPLAQGSTRFNLQKSDFMKKKFSFPMIEKQCKIYSILNTYSDKLIVEKQIIGLLCSQKRYLLRQLFI
ncbi:MULTISPECIES: restriction endonuclease subunit S [Bacteroidales]|uniref:restriction endonuclease subunit S n=1 Tax=Bacteroidales TaxID=171549 RepID=UPI001FCF9C25|nr:MULTISPECIES: restriction endonuclease subunit S [Bacteroidales]MCZ2727028.1 restriction endonuclease subunit S [Bacteroides caccae]